MQKLDLLLLVEDEEDHARLVKKALLQNGHFVKNFVWLKDGQAILDYLKASKQYSGGNSPLPSLILLDIKLPLKSGFEVLSEIKKDNRLRLIPVVMLTTTSNADDVRKALLLGANDYIVKPVVFAEFINKIRQLGKYWATTSDCRLVNNEG
ncbi:response regulator [candidate division KSB1 bacterium]|nr:response regulator [candidate division KSB1 bacterium]